MRLLRFFPAAALMTVLLAGLSACGGPQIKNQTELPFPPPPEKAKFYYERTLRVSSDIEGVGAMERFRIWVTGAPQVVDGLIKPFGVAVFRGRIYITDTVARAIKVFDISRNKYFEFGTDEPGMVSKPLGIDISQKGEVYVSDNTRRRVVVFDLDGKYLRTIGDKDELVRPSGVAVSYDGSKVYVIDTGGVKNDNHNLYIYDTSSGNLIKKVGSRGVGDGQFNLPLQVATARDGTVYVVDSGNFRVQAFDAEGNYQFKFGSIGRHSAQFSRPKGIAVDAFGRVYVVDTAFGNFQIFTGSGKLLLFVGQRSESGAPAGYMLPAGIDVDEDGRVYVVDQFYRKVDIYRPAHLKATQGYTAKR